MVTPQRWSSEDDRQAGTRDLDNEHGTDLAVELPSLAPLSHSQALLDPGSSKEWDVDAFLLSRSDLPLDELRSELREYLAELREELGVLINDEYEEFISLGLGLRGEAEQLEEIRLPLQVLKVEVESIRSTFQNTQSTLEGLLAERTSLREEKSVLDLLTHLTETLERTENLLGIRREVQDLDDEEPSDPFDGFSVSASDDRGRGRSSDKVAINGTANNNDSSVPALRPKLSVRIASSTDDIKSAGPGLPKKDVKMLRRIANEYTQLVYLTAKAKKEQCAYVVVGREGADVENRIETMKSTLNAHLATLFSDIITSLSDISRRKQQQRLQRDQIPVGDIKTQLMDCLEIYETIGGWREAEEVLRQFVKREAHELITSRALTVDRHQELAPATPFLLSMKNSTNTLSPTTSIKTPHTPNFGEDGARTTGEGAVRSVPNEDFNVFESTLSLHNNDSTAATETSLQPSLDVDDSRVPEISEISYLPETGPGGNLGAIYNGLLRYIEHDLRPVIDAANILRQRTKMSRYGKSDFALPSEVVESAGSATSAGEAGDPPKLKDLSLKEASDDFEFMGRVIWVEIGQRILSEIGNAVFAAGRVAELHQNYTITHHFLSQLELRSGSIRSVALIRSSETYRTFEKRWQLPIYFQLRWKEIVVALEDALSKGIITAKAGTTVSFTLPQSAAVITAVQACWAPTTYIPELGHRFLRLTLQILSRYRTWLEKSVPALYNSSSATLASNTSATSAPRQSMTISRSTTPQPGGSMVVPQGNPPSDSAAAVAEDNLLKISSMVVSDLNQIRKHVGDFWTTDVTPELETYLDASDLSQVNAAMQHSLAELATMSESPATQIQQILIRRCTDPLKLIRSVASQLRATTSASSQKDPEPSHFVSGILKPLKDYFAPNGPGDGLSEDCKQVWSESIVSEVVASYTSILVSVRKTEDLLRRHRKGKKTGFSLFGSTANAGPSVEEEEQRFKQQMTADIMALAKEAEQLGVRMGTAEAPQISGWTTLLEVADGRGIDPAGV